MDARRAPSPVQSLCPSCGTAIDPLRAGTVAIIDGSFRYFCGAACKEQFVDTSSRRQALDAMTADPPKVVSSGVRVPEPSFPPPTPSGLSDVADAPTSEEDEALAFPVIEETPLGAVDVRREDRVPVAPAREAATDEPRDAEDAEEDEDEDEAIDEPPATLRSPAVSEPRAEAAKAASSEPDAPRGPGVFARIASAAPAFGIACGVFAAALALAGEGAGAARLPLALLATAILVAQVLLRPREPSEPSPWLVVAAVVPAAVAAALARVTNDPHAEQHAAFVGLASAGALLAQLLVARAGRDVADARARVASALSVRARVVRGEETVEIDAARVKPGEEVVVEAGETIAVDGIVRAGGGEIAPWVDSPVVLTKREGDAVVAGATVVSGRVRINATFTGADRAWLRLASSPSARIDVTAPLVVFMRRAAPRGVPVAAALVAGATYANNGALSDVVVAACAGAFAVSAIAAIYAAGLAHARAHLTAQRRGIVYKDAVAFDGAGRADVAVVCSRGTILLGEPEIVAVEGVATKASVSERDAKSEVARVLSLAAGAEMGSTHPFAAAVLRAARARGVRPENVRSALKHSGLGVTALAPNGDKVIVGSRAFLLHEKVSVAIADSRVSELEAQGRSVLLVALGGRLVGLLALQDGLRPGARAAVQKLHDAHIEPVLLSGEARDTCETIARALDIEHVRPEVLPADRGAEVRALADGGHVIAAIGHASSDDGALGAADVSVAMSAAGSAPGEWGVALASDDVRDAALALTVPRACRERAKTAALVGAAAQTVAGLAIAFGLVPPIVAPVVAVLATAIALTLVRDPS